MLDPEPLADAGTEFHPLDKLREANQRLHAENKWLREIIEMVVEERDTWRWRVVGGDRPVCRHPSLHESTKLTHD